jgi:hypothetical protein
VSLLNLLLAVWQGKRKWLIHVSPIYKMLFSAFEGGFSCNTTVERMHYERKYLNTYWMRAAMRSMLEAIANVIISNRARVAAARKQMLEEGDLVSKKSVQMRIRVETKHREAQLSVLNAADAAAGGGSKAGLRTAEKKLSALQKAQAASDGAAPDAELAIWGAPRGKPAVPAGAREAAVSAEPPGDEGEAAAGAAEDAGGAGGDDDGPMAVTSKQKQLEAAVRGLAVHQGANEKKRADLEASERLVATSEERIAVLQAQVEAELLASKKPSLTDLPTGRDAAAAPSRPSDKCSMRGCSDPPAPGCAHGACAKQLHCCGQQAWARNYAKLHDKTPPPSCSVETHRPPATS